MRNVNLEFLCDPEMTEMFFATQLKPIVIFILKTQHLSQQIIQFPEGKFPKSHLSLSGAQARRKGKR
jgi:hypothetical protein